MIRAFIKQVIVVGVFLISSIITLQQAYSAESTLWEKLFGDGRFGENKTDLDFVIDIFTNDIDTALRLFDADECIKECFKCPLRYCLFGITEDGEKTDTARALERYGFYIYPMVTKNGFEKMQYMIKDYHLERIPKINETITLYKRQKSGNDVLIKFSFGYGIGIDAPFFSSNITDFEVNAYECNLSVPLDYNPRESPVFMAALVPQKTEECRHCHNREYIKDSIDESIKDTVEYSKALVKAIKNYCLIIHGSDKAYVTLIFEKKSTSQ